MTNQTDETRCPECQSTNFAEVQYGLPLSDDRIEPGKRDRREAINLGCCVDDEGPAWHCNECHNWWGRYADREDERDRHDDLEYE